jgi:hypothetical protein
MISHDPAVMTEQHRSQVTSAADNYVTTVAQAMDELAAANDDPQIALWAIEQKIAAATAAFTDASEPNASVAMLDLMILSTLKRVAVEKHWIEHLLHEDGRAVLVAYRHAEDEVWALGAQAFTTKQLDELRNLIDQWEADHPDQYYVSHARLTEFATSRGITAASPQAQVPGSILGLLYIDPLAKIDPMVRELYQSRRLAERLTYVALRTPMILRWHAEHAMLSPQAQRIFDDADRFSVASTQIAGTMAGYPAELAAHEQQIKSLLEQSRSVLQQASETAATIRSSATGTISETEQATQRTVQLAYNRLLTLLIVAIVGVTLSILIVRYFNARWHAKQRDHSSLAHHDPEKHEVGNLT